MNEFARLISTFGSTLGPRSVGPDPGQSDSETVVDINVFGKSRCDRTSGRDPEVSPHTRDSTTTLVVTDDTIVLGTNVRVKKVDSAQ